MQRSLQTQRAARLQSLRATVRPVVEPDPAAPETSAAPPDASGGRVGVWELWSEPGAHDEIAGEPLDAEVLRTIQGHPEGVRAIEIGNELGVDWRRVLGIASSLIDAGLVEQIDQEFYPVAKASRRW